MALASASHRATRRLNRARRAGSPAATQWRATTSTASSTASSSLGTRTEIRTAVREVSGSGTSLRRTESRRGTVTRSERLQGLVGGVGDQEQRVELGELEQRAEVFVQAGEPELAARLAQLLGERHQRAQAR